MTHPEAEPMFPIPAVYLIHGDGESASGPVKKLQAVLERHWPGLNFIRPDTSFDDPKRPADVAVKELLRIPMPKGCLLVGVGLGGSGRCEIAGARTPGYAGHGDQLANLSR
jgi:hypothetical protein